MKNENQCTENKELLPPLDSERTMSLGDYTILWAGMTINIVGFSLGAQYYNGGKGLSPWTVVWVMLLGYSIVTFFTILIGEIGTSYGIPFVVYSRAPFGYKGASVAGLLRAIPGIYWFGFLTFIGAEAMNYIMSIIFPGFNNLTLMIIAFAIMQIVNAMHGLEAMAKLDWIAIPSLGILFSAILIMILKKYNVSIPDIMSAKASGGYSIPYAIAGIAGGWITMALNGCDLTRKIKRDKNYEKMSFLQRNRRAIFGQVIGLMLVGVLTMLVGMAAGITSGYWDLNEVINDLFTNKISLILCYICVVFAQWSTNTAANLLPPSLVMLSIFPKIKYSVSTIICGAISVAILPWTIQDSGGFLINIQNWISQLLGPIIGIVLADYYLIRKCKVNVTDLYKRGGEYEYKNGYNISAFAALIISFVIGLFFEGYAFFVGLFLSIFIYYILMKYYTLKKYNLDIGKEISFYPDNN